MTDLQEKKIGYDGHFPSKTVIEFHRESYGIVNGTVTLQFIIEDGQLKSLDVSRDRKGVRYDNK